MIHMILDDSGNGRKYADAMSDVMRSNYNHGLTLVTKAKGTEQGKPIVGLSFETEEGTAFYAVTARELYAAAMGVKGWADRIGVDIT